MATVALVDNGNSVLSAVPFLVRRVQITGGDTGAALAHGETRSPDVVIPIVAEAASPVPGTISVVRNTSATTMTVDMEGDAAGTTIDLLCIWFSQASGGIS